MIQKKFHTRENFSPQNFSCMGKNVRYTKIKKCNLYRGDCEKSLANIAKKHDL